METQEAFIIEDGIEVAASVLRAASEDAYYGSVPGLADDELASPAELERQVALTEWGPVLALPFEASERHIRPTIDEFGHEDWGAFGTVDFARLHPPFDKARYKADKLRRQLRNDLIMLDFTREQVSLDARAQVRSMALRTEIDLDDIKDRAHRAYVKWLRRVRGLSKQIRELQEHSLRRRMSRA